MMKQQQKAARVREFMERAYDLGEKFVSKLKMIAFSDDEEVRLWLKTCVKVCRWQHRYSTVRKRI
jgi:hypothetical protein